MSLELVIVEDIVRVLGTVIRCMDFPFTLSLASLVAGHKKNPAAADCGVFV